MLLHQLRRSSNRHPGYLPLLNKLSKPWIWSTVQTSSSKSCILNYAVPGRNPETAVTALGSCLGLQKMIKNTNTAHKSEERGTIAQQGPSQGRTGMLRIARPQMAWEGCAAIRTAHRAGAYSFASPSERFSAKALAGSLRCSLRAAGAGSGGCST